MSPRIIIFSAMALVSCGLAAGCANQGPIPTEQLTKARALVEQADKALSSPKYHFGFGWGSDENGLGSQPGPTAPTISSFLRPILSMIDIATIVNKRFVAPIATD